MTDINTTPEPAPKPLPKLETKHWVWIFRAAADHFDEKIAECEREIARHHYFASEPLQRSGPAAKTRKDLKQDLHQFRKQYIDCLHWCKALSDKAASVNSWEFAEALTSLLGLPQSPSQSQKTSIG